MTPADFQTLLLIFSVSCLLIVVGNGLLYSLVGIRRSWWRAKVAGSPARASAATFANLMLAFAAQRIVSAYFPFPSGPNHPFGLGEAAVFTGGWALVSLAIWLQLIIAADNSDKSKKLQETEDDLAAARQQLEDVSAKSAEQWADREFFRLVNLYYLSVVGKKQEKLRKAKSKIIRIDPSEPMRSPYILMKEIFDPWFDAVKPGSQVAKLVTATHDILRAQINLVEPEASLRIAYFRREDGYLRLVTCWNCEENNKCVRSPGRSRRFRLNGAAASLAADAIQKGEILIVKNAFESDAMEDCRFNFFDNGQKKRIGSMVAIPCGEIPNEAADHIFCIDTTRIGYFHDGCRKHYEVIQRNIVGRLLYETDMYDIIKEARERLSSIGE